MINLKYVFVLLFALLTACAGGAQSQRTNAETSAAVKARAKAHTDLGAAYLQKNKLEIALEEFTLASRIMPSYALAYTGLALVRSALGQDEEAEYNFKKSLELDSSIAETYNNYGTFLCARSRYEESITQFLEAVKNPLYNRKNIAYSNAGICAKRKGDNSTAAIYLNKALAIQPLTHDAAHHLADIQFAQGDAVLANKTIQNALISSPNAEMLWLGVRIARALGNRNEESSYALELRRRFPNSKETQLLLSSGS